MGSVVCCNIENIETNTELKKQFHYYPEYSMRTDKDSALYLSQKSSDIKSNYRLRSDKNGIFARPCHQRVVMVSSESSSTYTPVPMTTIRPTLFVGSYDDAINEVELKAKGITHILSLIGNRSPVDFVQHKIVPMHDRGRTDLKRILKQVSKFVKLGQQDGNRVLVHCQ